MTFNLKKEYTKKSDKNKSINRQIYKIIETLGDDSAERMVC